MKKTIKSNRGFTLVELIIALAILAFLMTAISSLMGTSIFSFKKTKSDIKVHSAAQDTYNKISDSIMQANEIVIVGYYINEGDLNFVKNQDTITYTPTLKVFVKNDKIKEYVLDNKKMFTDAPIVETDVMKFSEIVAGKQICVKDLVTFNAAQIDMAMVTGGDVASASQVLYNPFTASSVTIKIENTVDIKDGAGNVIGTKVMYDQYDTVLNRYIFMDENMYYVKKHAYMDKADDYHDVTVVDLNERYKNHEYNEALCYLKCTNGTAEVNLSGCIAEVDPKTGAIGIDLHFNNVNMTYTTNGMMHPRNSYVLIDKK